MNKFKKFSKTIIISLFVAFSISPAFSETKFDYSKQIENENPD